jgi:hypothetical protein
MFEISGGFVVMFVVLYIIGYYIFKNGKPKKPKNHRM